MNYGANNSEPKILHVYQRSENGFLLFYTVTDILVFFSIISVCSRKHKTVALAVCPMRDHVHLLLKCGSRKEAEPFIREYSALYAQSFNESMGRHGKVFRKSFGCAVKTGLKRIRTACSYVYNNPVEKGIGKRAEECRWTFLAYAKSEHPFSEPYKARLATTALKKSIQLIQSRSNRGLYLTHKMLEQMFASVSERERNQLADYIVSLYNPIDYRTLISFYGDYSMMCLAFASNQGSEYDILEERGKGSDRVYSDIASVLLKDFGFSRVKDVLKATMEEIPNIYLTLLTRTAASPLQVRKYMRLAIANDWPSI